DKISYVNLDKCFENRGLPNQGLTCYLNSAFLLRVQNEKLFIDFAQMIKSCYLKRDSEETNFEFYVKEFFSTFFTSELSRLPYRANRQHDPNEFLVDFFKYIDNCITKIECSKSSMNDSKIQIVSSNNQFRFLENSFQLIISRSTICAYDKSHGKTNQLDKLMQLFLSIESSDILTKSLDENFSSSITEDTIYCDFCKKKQKMAISYKIDTLNDNLVITLNRMKLNSGEYSKIMDFIAIDEYVNFGKYYANEENNKDDVQEKVFFVDIIQSNAMIRGKIPQLALSNGLQFPDVNVVLSRLNDLEERLCSPRVAFIRIKDLQQWDKQKKLCGNVINVPIDTQRTLEKLPRNFNQSETIQIKFKRKLGFEQDYKYERVRPSYVLEAVKFLVKKPLFIENGIHIDDDWFFNLIS
ncbi:unnamed protein product, partial [Brachionus calyciflorus]